MVFSSLTFVFFFLPILLVLVLLFPRLRNLILLIGSLIFYAWGGPGYAILLLGSITVNYFIGLSINKRRTSDRKRVSIFIGIFFNILVLCIFKYSNFIIDSINPLLGNIGLNPIYIKEIDLPLGISFFTFQSISYLLDVYRGTSKVQRNFVDLSLYISFFPQLIAGPIVRYQDMAEQLKTRSFRISSIGTGIQRFIIGLSKKVLLANNFAYAADDIFSLPPEFINTPMAWFGALCYTLQIYFDFSAYSDMAIGLGGIFGFKIPENFNLPYIAKSIREFWRRWHMTLSNWFRDYLYIPLGGNRLGKQRTLFNLFLVFFLTGLWHGASWTFVCWGMVHGIFMILERGKWGQILSKLWLPFQHLYTLLIVVFAWVLFKAKSFEQAKVFMKAMFGFYDVEIELNPIKLYLDNERLICLAVAILLSTGIGYMISKHLTKLTKNLTSSHQRFVSFSMDTIGAILVMTLFISSLSYLAAGSYNPFIYFKF